MDKRSFLPDTPERQTFARGLLLVYAFMALFVGPLAYGEKNYPVLFFACIAIVSVPIVLRLSSQRENRQLPTKYALLFLVAMVCIAGVEQMHRMPNLAWLVLYPFTLLYLAGLRTGLALTVIVFLVMVSYYLAYPLLGRPSQVPVEHFMQILLAYVTATALAYYQESIRERHEDQLLFLSEGDPLTGLDNRRGFLGKAESVLAQAKRMRQPFCIALVDLDDFKQINDIHGHEAGDTALRVAAEIIRANSRAYDLVGRWGGEEFILLLPQSTAEGGWRLAEKLRRELSLAALPCGRKLTASIGLSVFDGEEGLDQLIARADEEMYRAKGAGKNQVCPVMGETALIGVGQ